MKLIVGLGNPGPKYKKTRHNVGFRAIEAMASNFQFSIFNFQLKSELSKGEIGGEKIILVKPKTFMNRSGQAVKAVANYYKIKPQDIWVIHDDIDLPLGTIRISQDGSSGGHKGIQSIINHLKTRSFPRFRIGIRPRMLDTECLHVRHSVSNMYINAEKFVLQKFTKTEEKIIERTIKKTVQATETALKEGLEKAMNKFN